MSAKELMQWVVWMQVEQVGPAWDRVRHAQLLAAVCNGGRYERKDKRAFNAEDFTTLDPWQEEQPKEIKAADLALELSLMEAMDTFVAEE